MTQTTSQTSSLRADFCNRLLENFFKTLDDLEVNIQPDEFRQSLYSTLHVALSRAVDMTAVSFLDEDKENNESQ